MPGLQARTGRRSSMNDNPNPPDNSVTFGGEIAT
jgi:hypothetical protein